MAKREYTITEASRGAAITVKIVPKATVTELAGIEPDGTLRIRLTAPPVGDEINEELIGFLSAFLSIPPENVEIVAGQEGRKKLVSLLHISTGKVSQLVHEALVGKDEPDI